MMTYGEPRAPARGRAAFTLVELLVVISIIAILTTLTLGVMQSARELARIERTKATIRKIDTVLQERYESYQTRRVALDTRPGSLAADNPARYRLLTLRDLMRMEMPECWDDVTRNPEIFAGVSIRRPALSSAYHRRLNDAKTRPGNTPEQIAQYESAECLYLIVTLGSPEARSRFSDREIGDVDGDGLFEFIDGWGNPIKFIRWAPGLCDSDMQRVVATPGGGMDRDAMALAVEEDYDPFDMLGVDDYRRDNPSDPVRPPRPWRLLPFIYSAGPDGIYDIAEWRDYEQANPGVEFSGNPYYFRNGSDRPVNWIGRAMPIPSDSATRPENPATFARTWLGHYDNIHNHRVEVK